MPWIINEWVLVFVQPLKYSALWSKSQQASQVELCNETLSLLHLSVELS